jgi:3-phosphoshikimate 1-carboxyvinyltransferase
MAMAMSLAAFNGAAGAAPPMPVRIGDPRCVAKTWPDYFEALFSVASAVPGEIPALTIDGPTASGKGTLASAVAAELGYVLLDSGAVYRAVAIAALQAGVEADDEAALERSRARWTCASRRPHLPRRRRRQRFAPPRGRRRARLAHLGLSARSPGRPRRPDRVPAPAWPGRRRPRHGHGRLPRRRLKVFLTASAAERAERRHKQLISKGISANIDSLRADLEARDARDINRSASPLKPAEGAFLLDNSALTIEASVAAVLEAWEKCRPFDRPQV